LKTQQLWFTSPGVVVLKEADLEPLQQNQVRVRSLYSAISAGTEMLIYRGQFPTDLPLDSSLQPISMQPSTYPLQYGYATVGLVEDIGSSANQSLLGKRVFAFQPHCSLFNAVADSLVVVPEGIETLSAVFLANMETAVTLVLDGAPLLGEQCLVIGQGVVGLLTTRLLSRFPVAGLLAVDSYQKRLDTAQQFGAEVYDHNLPADRERLKSSLAVKNESGGADLIYELSGEPAALDLAINLSTYSGRVVVGSWYGTKTAELNLGGRFHRNRIRLISSQVSTIDPALRGRWSKQRRFTTTWDAIRSLPADQLVSHKVSFNEAAEAYQTLAQSPDKALQVVLDHTE